MTNQSKIIENLELAIAAVEATPDQAVNLAQFRNECGTLHCTLGLLAEMPHFQAQGLALVQKRDEWGHGYWEVTIDGDSLNGATKSFDQGLVTRFGSAAWGNLFASSGLGHHDHWHRSHMDKPESDKQLALARLKFQLKVVQLNEAKNARS